MKRGWFVGNFEPSLVKQNAVEVAIKIVSKGDREESHYHKRATEITAVVSGRVRMVNKEFKKGDIILLEPYEETSFEALEDSTIVVVKIPGAENDKYLSE